MTKQLEKVYLLNVLLYIDSLESVKTFISINKKCHEVSTMLRLYTKKRRIDLDFPHETIIPQNLFKIFPTIETIECDEIDLLQQPEIMKNVTFINLNISSKDDWKIQRKRREKHVIERIPKEIREKIQIVRYFRSSYKYSSSFSELFPNCRILICNEFVVDSLRKKSPQLQLDKLISILEQKQRDEDEYSDEMCFDDSFDSDDYSDEDFSYSDEEESDEDYCEYHRQMRQNERKKQKYSKQIIKERILVSRMARTVCDCDYMSYRNDNQFEYRPIDKLKLKRLQNEYDSFYYYVFETFEPW